MNRHRRLWLGRAACAGIGAPAAGALSSPLAGVPAGPLCATLLAALAGLSRTAAASDEALRPACAPLLSHPLRPLAGSEAQPLCERFADQVLLFVNTASKCGFTPQFDGLDTLHERYRERGFSVLGFPSDDFRQELASEAAVAQFCELNYGVDFPMFQKVGVRGDGAHPLYRELAASGGGEPNWNFNKYLVSRDGVVIGRYGSGEQPLGDRLVTDIEALL